MLTRRGISLKEADFLANVVIESASKKPAKRELNRWCQPIVVAVCDEAGNLKVFKVMDGALLISQKCLAFDKAHTAVLTGSKTGSWVSSRTDISDPHFTTLEGGVPIYEDGYVVGAVGVSGRCGSREELIKEAEVIRVGVEYPPQDKELTEEGVSELFNYISAQEAEGSQEPS